jgi:hypothetical protein
LVGVSCGPLRVPAPELGDGAADLAAYVFAEGLGVTGASLFGGLAPCGHAAVAEGEDDSAFALGEALQDRGQASVAGDLVK